MKVVVICIPNEVSESSIKNAMVKFSEQIGFNTKPVLLSEEDTSQERLHAVDSEFVKLVKQFEAKSGYHPSSSKFKEYLKASIISTNNKEALRILMTPSTSDLSYLTNIKASYIPELAAKMYYIMDM